MKKLIPIVACLIAMNTIVSAQINIELKTMINKSFVYFPKLIEAENTIQTAKEKLELVRLNNSATITAFGSYNFTAPVPEFEIGANKIQFQPHNNFNTNLNANYTLFDFGRQKANIEKSKTELEFTKYNVESIQHQLAAQISTIYYNIIYLKKAISIQDTVIHFLYENKTIIEKKLNNGDALKFDIVNIQASISNEENRKIDLINNLKKQLYLLQYSSGFTSVNHANFDFNPNSSNQLLDVTTAVTEATKKNIEFIIAKNKIQQAISELNILKLQEKPTINSNALLGYRNGFAPDIYQYRFNYLIGVNISVPIYTGGKMKQSMKLQNTLIKQFELTLESLEATHLKDIQQTISDIHSNEQQIKNTNEQTKQAEYALKLASIRLLNGIGNNLELINASSNVQRALLTKLQYEYQFCIANIQLFKLLGEKYW